MPCPCKELEREHGGGGCKCVHYREAFPNCECEGHSVSDYSPSAVEDDEILIRTLYSPVQINSKTGHVDPAHLRHDARTRGLSVNRKDHISEQALRTRIEEKIVKDREEGKHRDDFYCVAVARCGTVRALEADDGQRLFCVYDTATEDDASHADVCQSIDPPPKTPNRNVLRKKIGSRLLEAFLDPTTDVGSIYADDGPLQ